MRKIALFCLSSMVAASLVAGCGGSNNNSTTASQESTASSSEASSSEAGSTAETEAAKPENLGSMTLGEYKGVTVNVPEPEVTDDEVESQIQSTLAQNATEVEVDRAAQEGDIVNIDYKGTQDGVEFAGGSAEGYDLTLGSGSFIDGFEDGVIGMKKGETKNLELTFPEDYGEASLAGQKVNFEVKLNAVKEKKDAVLDDAFVQEHSDCQTVEEYREQVRADLLEQKLDSAELQKQQQALQAAVEGSTFKLSKNAVSKRYTARIKQYEAQAKMYGMSLSQLAQANGTDIAGFKQSVYASVESEAQSQLTIDTIAAQENITVSDADLEDLASQNGQTAEQLVEGYGESTANQLALNYKVMKFLADNAVNTAETAESAGETESTQEAN